jgi:hypothetical protein
MTKRWQQPEFWIAAIGFVIAAALWHARLRFPFDDTFISFRYAEHFSSDYGLVWNIGEAHTEGFTNFLFVLLLATARLITGDLLATAQAIGLASTIVTAVMIYGIVATLRDRAAGILAVSFYWTAPLTWVNALSGMETSLFGMLCATTIFFILRRRFVPAFGVAFLASLTRPEAALLALIGFGCILLFSGRKPRRITAFVFAFLLPSIGYLLWKYFYFGALLPNAFYLKVLGNSHSILPGLQYVRFFVTSSIVLVALSFCVRKWDEAALLTASLWAVMLISCFLFVLPIEGLYDRFLWPAYVMLSVTGAIGLRDLASRMKPFSFGWLALLALAANGSIMALSPRTQQSFAAHEDVWDANMDHVVRELTLLPHLDSIRIAYGDAGYVVYKSGIYHIDLFGLNDTRIAHAHSVAERAAIVRSERPDILLLPIRLQTDGPAEFVEDAFGLARSSEFENAATIEAFPYTLVLLLNKSSPWYLECKNSISQRSRDSSSYLRATGKIIY